MTVLLRCYVNASVCVLCVRATRNNGVPLRETASCPRCAPTPRCCSPPSGSGTDTAWICLAGVRLSTLCGGEGRRGEGRVKGRVHEWFTLWLSQISQCYYKPNNGTHLLVSSIYSDTTQRRKWSNMHTYTHTRAQTKGCLLRNRLHWPRNIQETFSSEERNDFCYS